MKFEIKSTDGSVLFSIETETLKLAVEAALRAHADLSHANFSQAKLFLADFSWANLSWADFSWADLSHANFSQADLSCADFSWADLSHANLSQADLSCADFSWADLSHANLSQAKLFLADFSWANLSWANGINKYVTTPLLILADQPGPVWAYKLVKGNGEDPYEGGIDYLDSNTDGFSVAQMNNDETERSGAGINLATLDWCIKHWQSGYRILIMEFFVNEPENNLCIPISTDGKFRVRTCKRIGEKNLTELGLLKGESKWKKK